MGREDNVVPREGGSGDAEAAICADIGTSRAVMDLAKHQGLASLSGFPFEVRTSASTREQAGQLADRCVGAYSYLGEMLAFRPRCALVVLNRADWSERASNPLYGSSPTWRSTRSWLPKNPIGACTMMAKGLIDAAGPTVLRRLWDAFALSDEQLAGVLGGRIHPAAGQWLASWNELQWT